MNPRPTWKGAAKLRPALVPVAELRTHPNNPRRGDVGEIAKSLARFGQVRAVLAQPDGTIVAGNHTYLAACELGWTHVAVVRHEFASPTEARAYLLADNRLGDEGEYDRQELLLFLDDLERTGQWEGTGYEPDDLAHLRGLDKLAAAPPAAPPPPPAAAGPPEVLKEVVLLLTEDQHEQFSSNLRIVRHELGLEGVLDPILAAVAAEAFRLNQGEASAEG